MTTPVSKPADAIEEKVDTQSDTSGIRKAPEKNVDAIEAPPKPLPDDDPGKPI